MKKFALAMCAVLALSATASAGTATIGTTINVSGSGSVKSINGVLQQPVIGGASLDNQLLVSLTGKGDGWSAEADLNKMMDLKVNSYRFGAQNGPFTLTVWANKEVGADIATPFSYIASYNEGNAGKLRATYSIATADVESGGNTFVFAKQAIGTLTLGGAYNTNLQGNLGVVDGYVSTQVGPAAVTGEIAMKSTDTIKDQNSKLGAKADVAVTGDVQAYGEFQSYAKNFGDENKVVGKLTYKPMTVWGQVTVDTTSVSNVAALRKATTFEVNQTKDYTLFDGKMINTVDNAGADKGKTLDFLAKYRGGKDVSFDYLFNASDDSNAKYYANKALAAMFEYNSTTSGGADNAKNTITAKAEYPIIPDKAWVVGSLVSTSDNDGGLTIGATSNALPHTSNFVALGGAAAKSSTQLDVNARYLASSKLTLDGAFKSYSAGTDSYSQVYAKANYQFVSNMSVNASLTQESSNKFVKGVQTLQAGYSFNF